MAKWRHLELEQLGLSETMAENKLRGQKSRNIPTASQKSFKVKNKAKPATTNLKINTVNDEKANRE